MTPNRPYAIGTSIVGADASSTTAVIAGVTNRTFSIRDVVVSVTAACTITIEDSTGADIFTLILPARGGASLYFDPDVLPVAASGRGVNVISSTSDVISAKVTAWFKDA